MYALALLFRVQSLVKTTLVLLMQPRHITQTAWRTRLYNVCLNKTLGNKLMFFQRAQQDKDASNKPARQGDFSQQPM